MPDRALPVPTRAHFGQQLVRWLLHSPATDPQLAFRERATRLTLAFTLALNPLQFYSNLDSLLNLPPLNRLILPIILVWSALIGLTIFGLVRRHITLASIALTLALTTNAWVQAFTSSYFSPLLLASIIFMMLAASSLLPLKLLVAHFGLQSVILTLVLYWQVTSGYLDQRFPTGYIPPTPTMIWGLIVILMLILLAVILILRSESDRRLAAYRDLVASLEQRIADRTADLDAARLQAERLYHIADQVNAANSYTAILQAVADQLAPTDFGLILALYPNFTRVAATHFRTVARLPTGERTVLPADDLTPLVIDLSTTELLVVENLADYPDDTARAALNRANVQAFAAAEIRLAEHGLGLLVFVSTHPRHFTPLERDLLTTVADLAAAAIERIRLYDEQVRTAEELRRADQAKDSFLATTSHELRTPLNAIINFTQFVSSGMLGPVNARQVDALDKSLSSARHLLALINDMLDISRLAAGRMQIVIEAAVDIRPELLGMAQLTDALLTDRPVTFTLDLPPDLPTIDCDPTRLRQILLNLVSNACKFTEQGHITLSVHAPDPDHLAFTVTDTGPGILPEDLPTLFDPFIQNRSGARKGGAGLGLAITHGLVHAHRGEITVSSTLGHGTTFTVTLPRHQPDALIA